MADRHGVDTFALLALLVDERGGTGADLHTAIERLGATLVYARLGTWAWDLRDGRSTWSAEQYRMLGHEPFSIQPSFEQLQRQLHPDDVARCDAEFQAALREDRWFDAEYRVIWPNGETHWLEARAEFVRDERGQPVQMFGVTIDIDRVKRAEQTANAALARLQTIAEATPGTIFTCRMEPDGTRSFPYATAHLRDTHGIDPEALKHDPSLMLDRINPDDAEKVLLSTIESARTGSMWHAQFRHRHPEKGEIWLEAYSSPIREPDGAVTWHGIAHDITHLKAAEIELLQAQRRAETADRAKSEFLANMSHEIRTPMSAIMGYADMLRASLTNSDDLQNVETIVSNSRYLIKLIDDILDLSRIEAGKVDLVFERVRPDTLVHEVRSLLERRAQEKGLALKVTWKGPLPEAIRTDSTRLRQILINLVENAIKFTDRGEVGVVLELLRPEAKLAIEVADTGPGIPEPTLAQLFQPFSQGDSTVTRRFGGTGLGLSISRRIANMLGGDIVVTTRVGAGSTFRLTIDVGDLTGVPLFELSHTEQATISERRPLRSLAARVLVVDDRREMRHLATHMLEEAGADVVSVGDGAAAVRKVGEAQASGVPFDAILLDMQMPVLDGYAAAEQLRRDGYDKPIIALTAHAMKEDESRCLACGCDHYLSKPLERATLVDAIAHYTQDISLAELAAQRAIRMRAASTRPTGKVLFVDDNADACSLAKFLLERAGFEVATATSGPAALAAAGPFDGVVLDLGLPGMSGAQVVAELKQRPELRLCRFICLSGYSLGEAEWHQLGFDHFLQKPAHFDDLQRLLVPRAAGSGADIA